jgi:hypothetical protein
MNLIQQLNKARILMAAAAMLSLPILMPSMAHAATSPSACRSGMKLCVEELSGTWAACALQAIDDGWTTAGCLAGIAAAGAICNITNLQNSCAIKIYPDNTDYATTESLGSVATPSGITKASLTCSGDDALIQAVRQKHDGNRVVELAVICSGSSTWLSTDTKVAGVIGEERQCRNGQMVGGLKGKETNYSVQTLAVMCTSYDGTTPSTYAEKGNADSGAVLNTMGCNADSYIYGLDYYYPTNVAGTSGFYIVGIKALCRG